MEKKILSQRQTMEYLDCSRTHLHRLVKKGIIKPKFLGRKPYYNLDQIKDAMMDQPENL